MRFLTLLSIFLIPFSLMAGLEPSAAVSRKYVDVAQARVDAKYVTFKRLNGKKALIPVSTLKSADLDWFRKVQAVSPLTKGNFSVKVVDAATIPSTRQPKNTIVTSQIVDGVETVQLCSPNVFRDQIGGTCMLYARVHWLDIAGYYSNNGTIYKSINGAPPTRPWDAPQYAAGLITILTDHSPRPITHTVPPYGGNNFEWAREQLRQGRPILAAFPKEIWQALPSGYLAKRQWNGGVVGHQIVVNGFTYNPKDQTGTFHIINSWRELPEFDLKLKDAARGILAFEQSISPYGQVPQSSEPTTDILQVEAVKLLRSKGDYSLYEVTTNQGVQRIIATDSYTAQRLVEEAQ